jgi:acyl CoA:acetate/3-ketoacid CoA transferase alpha subunit
VASFLILFANDFMNKVVLDADEAISDIKDGDVLMLGGFWSLRYSGELHCCIGEERT